MNMSADSFGVSQVYAIIVLPNGGPDLETFTFKTAARTGWRQACSLFWQVTRSLAEAEELVHFEVYLTAPSILAETRRSQFFSSTATCTGVRSSSRPSRPPRHRAGTQAGWPWTTRRTASRRR